MAKYINFSLDVENKLKNDREKQKKKGIGLEDSQRDTAWIFWKRDQIPKHCYTWNGIDSSDWKARQKDSKSAFKCYTLTSNAPF